MGVCIGIDQKSRLGPSKNISKNTDESIETKLVIPRVDYDLFASHEERAFFQAKIFERKSEFAPILRMNLSNLYLRRRKITN